MRNFIIFRFFQFLIILGCFDGKIQIPGVISCPGVAPNLIFIDIIFFQPYEQFFSSYGVHVSTLRQGFLERVASPEPET